MNYSGLFAILLVGAVVMISGCVTYESLYKYADSGTLSHPEGLKFNYPSDWELGKIESPFFMSLYEGESVTPSIDIFLASRHSERLGYIENIEDLRELSAAYESDYYIIEDIKIETIGNRSWVITESVDKDTREIQFDFITICPSYLFNVDLFTNSTEVGSDILYPIAESLEC